MRIPKGKILTIWSGHQCTGFLIDNAGFIDTPHLSLGVTVTGFGTFAIFFRVGDLLAEASLLLVP